MKAKVGARDETFWRSVGGTCRDLPVPLRGSRGGRRVVHARCPEEEIGETVFPNTVAAIWNFPPLNASKT
jgi:hypothetical protein